jgi:hypothetical protein
MLGGNALDLYYFILFLTFLFREAYRKTRLSPNGRGDYSKFGELQAILEEGEPQKPELVPFDGDTEERDIIDR